FFFQAEDGIRGRNVTGVQTCALPIFMMLTMIAWFLTLFLGLLTQFDGLDISLLVESFKEFSIGGVLLFILSTPIILVTLVMKNYVPTIIFTVVITLINVM